MAATRDFVLPHRPLLHTIAVLAPAVSSLPADAYVLAREVLTGTYERP